MGIYLPVGVTALIVVGAVLGHLYNRWAERQANPGFAERMGVLTATGFIVGDSLFNVVYAGLVAGSDDVDVLAVTEATGWQTPAGVLLFVGIIVLLYGWTRSRASQALSGTEAPPPTQAAPR
jgi:energy-converting hydrogenase Eha subunit B